MVLGDDGHAERDQFGIARWGSPCSEPGVPGHDASLAPTRRPYVASRSACRLQAPSTLSHGVPDSAPAKSGAGRQVARQGHADRVVSMRPWPNVS